MAWLPGWLHRQPPEPPPTAEPGPFDVVVTIGPFNLPPGVAPPAAMAAIKQGLRTTPGARRISVQHHPAGSVAAPVSVFPTGRTPPPPGLQAQLERAVLAAITGLRHPPATASADPAAPYPIATPQLQPTGFSDAQTLSRFTVSAPIATPTADPTSLPGMADVDLLAHLLRHVVPAGEDAAARRAITRFGSFAATLSAPDIELRKLPGFGPHSVATIKLVHAAALRLSQAAVMNQPVLDGAEALIGYLTAVLARESIEHFRILFLDAEGRLRADEAQARGTVNHTPVYPREVARRALELRAASIILVHNHPSGDPTPSPADIEMTATIEQAAKAVGLAVHDHIIVGNGRWFSFRNEGFLGD